MCQWNRLSSIQTKACSKPYHYLDQSRGPVNWTLATNVSETHSKHEHLHSLKCIRTCPLQNGGMFSRPQSLNEHTIIILYEILTYTNFWCIHVYGAIYILLNLQIHTNIQLLFPIQHRAGEECDEKSQWLSSAPKCDECEDMYCL